MVAFIYKLEKPNKVQDIQKDKKKSESLGRKL